METKSVWRRAGSRCTRSKDRSCSPAAVVLKGQLRFRTTNVLDSWSARGCGAEPPTHTWLAADKKRGNSPPPGSRRGIENVGDNVSAVESVEDKVSEIESVGDKVSAVESVGDYVSAVESVGDYVSAVESVGDKCSILCSLQLRSVCRTYSAFNHTLNLFHVLCFCSVSVLISLTPVPHAQERPGAVLSVSPQSWLTEGDSVTLSCEITDSSTDWTFSWYTEILYRDNDGRIRYRLELLSDSSRGSGGSYTLSPAALNHTGVYMCIAAREEQPFYTNYSHPQPLWITGESPPVSLIINPSRTQHFTRDSLSLSCEDQSNSTRWRVIRYTHREIVSDCSQWGSVTGSTCKISFLSTSYTGVYWCESESGENSNPVNITVHDGDVILESPVHPVTEGHPLTLRCLYRYTKSSNLRADFYKDGSVLQTQTTGEMIIRTVSKSDEGFYHCKHPERGESLKSWVSVRGPSGVEAPFSVLMLISSVVTASPYLLVTIILLVKCYRT
ncbi:uncharacterized protein LOC124627497 [Ictalurus punctatus]|uniref:Uncharacterized protein LOC124627497 n=1 Tax=Ictalurus punctatus TaxID=7998 RepID=A0A9F7TM44_ICTPU|nr:uncharacterized protein LOC124627497 [Ictalurus punctatus]